jgi:glycosyltransferase involved in cell wall biosynthesis
MHLDSNIIENKIAIILSTYNGEKYIAEQLDAIQKQTHTNWHCYIRDDGSKDSSPEILKKYINSDSRFSLAGDIVGNMGLNASHYYLISLTTENYIAMCDQDDVWDANKLEVSISRLQEIETIAKIPALVHTESIVVDSQLNIIHPFFIGSRGNAKGLNGILFANSAQGGSIMINASLKNIAIKTAPKLPYDYHLAIIAELVGVRGFIAQTLLKYRQHSASSIATGNLNHTLNSAKNNLSPSLNISLKGYTHIKNDFNQIKVSKQVEGYLADYFYLFEGENRFKKLFIFFKNRYPFYRKKDLVSFIYLLIKNENLKEIATR